MNLTPVATVVSVGIAFALGRLTRRAEICAARREANTDPLTGLPNRTALERHLQNRTQAGTPYSLLMLDLNGFKGVNDTFGHRAGDELLRRVAGRLRASTAGHLLARLGGDEFVVLVDGPAQRSANQLLAEHIMSVLDQPFTLPGSTERVVVGTAIGIATSVPGTAWSATLHGADLAMYRSKATGVPHHLTVAVRQLPTRSPRQRVRDTRPVRVA